MRAQVQRFVGNKVLRLQRKPDILMYRLQRLLTKLETFEDRVSSAEKKGFLFCLSFSLTHHYSGARFPVGRVVLQISCPGASRRWYWVPVLAKPRLERERALFARDAGRAVTLQVIGAHVRLTLWESNRLTLPLLPVLLWEHVISPSSKMNFCTCHVRNAVAVLVRC